MTSAFLVPSMFPDPTIVAGCPKQVGVVAPAGVGTQTNANAERVRPRMSREDLACIQPALLSSTRATYADQDRKRNGDADVMGETSGNDALSDLAGNPT